MPASIVVGEPYLFTARLATPSASLLVEHAYDLRRAVKHVRRTRPFDIVAWVALPDHVHAIVVLPDDAMAARWSLVRTAFAPALPASRDPWASAFRHRRLPDDDAVERQVDAIHDDPVRHGLVARAADWPLSSLDRYVRRGERAADWRAPPHRTRAGRLRYFFAKSPATP